MEARSSQVGAAELENAVSTRMRVTGRPPVCHVGDYAGSECWRHEAGALEADVPSARQSRFGESGGVSCGIDCEDPPALLVGRNEVAGEAAERVRWDSEAPRDPWRVCCQHRDGVQAVQREQDSPIRGS